jgi:F-box interacting protein
LDHEQLQPVARLDSLHVCVKASCDGLLLLAEGVRGTPTGMSASICNPATRQMGRLPQLKGYVAMGLYRHRPTGEYRLLLRWWFSRSSMYVLELDRHELPLRRIQCPPDASHYRLSSSSSSTPVLLHGNLHWTLDTLAVPRRTEIQVFDTTAESFRRMTSPDVPIHGADLFEMDGVLGMYSWDNDMRGVRIWAMQEYESHAWALKCSVELPMMPEMPLTQERRRSLMVVCEEGVVRVLVACGGLLLCVDTEGKLLASSRDDDHSLSISKQFLKTSLVSHDFFSTFQGDMNAWPFI